MYVLNLDEDMRILSAWDKLPGANYGNRPIVDALPEGNLYDYRYEDGEYIHDPLPIHDEPDPQPTQLDRIEAQVLYTALMTDTILEEV